VRAFSLLQVSNLVYLCTMQMDRLYALYKQYPKVQTDTRALAPNELFFALKGPSFNGNLFAQQAMEMGAAGVVIDEPIGIEADNIFLVDNALETLQALALHHRRQLKIPFIAITGSNGKTTTKELLHAVLSSTYKTYTTKGNLNNHIGVPLTILSIKDDAAMAIIEMGANHQKEIESYCKIAMPTHGIINNCGKAHLEGFGGVEGIRKGKGELFDFLSLNNGTAFINAGLDYLIDMSSAIKNKIFYGGQGNSFEAAVFQSEPLLALEIKSEKWGTQQIFTQLVGAYNKPNIEAAICVGDYFGIAFESIKRALEAYTPDNARSQLIKKGNNTIILDAYNANPSSMQAAIENFSLQQSDNKYMFLGGMMELGEESIAEHQSLVEMINRTGIKNVVLVGGDFAHVDHHATFFTDAAQATEWIKQNTPSNALILIKGSRGIKMEKLLESF
jgi:UDP-N-acetylmuramoyl-tripeptide--D-alanyl-D-alanine ligase